MSWGYHYFKEEEFDHPDKISHELLARLDYARVVAGVPFHITSDYRDPVDGEQSAHFIGKAVDIAAEDSRTRHRILIGARRAGFRRLGVYDKHVHLDVASEADGFDQDVTWWGKSR